MASPSPVLIFWQEILPGDLRKMEAQSNDSPSGGGARDLRFPDARFRPVFERMFPRDEVVRGRAVRRGTLVWDDDRGKQEQVVDYWPPTEARQSEGRLARIHELEPLHDPPEPGDDRLILLLILDDQSDVRAFYALATDLQARWHADVSGPILECLGHRKRENVASRGWIDLTNGDQYCHGAE